MGFRTPRLDFIVIGAQKAGTTALWRYLEDNERLRMPPDKEASFFSEPGYSSELRAYMRALFKDAPRTSRLGTVTPVYMLGVPGVPVGTIAERIRRTFADVKLVVLLRDPVARARSAHRMAVRDGRERRSFRTAVADLLAPDALERARAGPDELTSYVVGGEYGRILHAYLEHFDPGRIHIELSTDLERDPGAVVTRVCTFLGVEPHVPGRAGERFYPGGRRRVTTEAELDLKAYLNRNVWPRVRYADQHRQAFEFWFKLWNAEPAPDPDPVDESTAALLGEHYADDARLLDAVTGLQVPWTEGASTGSRVAGSPS